MTCAHYDEHGYHWFEIRLIGSPGRDPSPEQIEGLGSLVDGYLPERGDVLSPIVTAQCFARYSTGPVPFDEIEAGLQVCLFSYRWILDVSLACCCGSQALEP